MIRLEAMKISMFLAKEESEIGCVFFGFLGDKLRKRLPIFNAKSHHPGR